MSLDSPVAIKEDGRGAGQVSIDHATDEIGQVEPAARHAGRPAFGVIGDVVDPDLGQPGMAVGIDVEMRRPAALQGQVEPGILGDIGIQDIARLVHIGTAFGIVVIVISGIRENV